jgi:hypothetical protein
MFTDVWPFAPCTSLPLHAKSPGGRKLIVVYNEPSLSLQENFGASDQITMALGKSRPLRPQAIPACA